MSASQPSARPYVIESVEVLATTPDLRMTVFTVGAGQEIPWHWHSAVSDTYFGMEGVVVVETRAPAARFEIGPGQTGVVPPKRAHRVAGKDGGRCKFAILQGVGTYDFNPVGKS
ncbi:MAG: cupin domain-containing protein [Alphaproteobacteria bacterium]|nr:cupin domain-containing protein [Alphaproteobacteria bacterium]